MNQIYHRIFKCILLVIHTFLEIFFFNDISSFIISNLQVLNKLWAREWRKLYNEELNDLYCSPNIFRVIKSRRMKRVGHVARMGVRRGVYRVLLVKHEGKRPLGGPRRGWEDNIKMDLQKVGCGGMDWIELAQDRDR